MLKQVWWRFGAGLFLVCVMPLSAQAQCVQLEPAEIFRLANVVFVGTVRATEPSGARGDHIVMHRAQFDVERVWKGQVRKVELVGTVEAFEPGRRYLVFAAVADLPELGPGQRGLRTSLECGWSEPAVISGGPAQRWLADQTITSTAPSTD